MAGEEPRVLQLRARGPAGPRPVEIPNITSASTYEELEDALRIALTIPEDQLIAVLAGIPPKPLEMEPEALLAGVIAPQEILTVRLSDGGAATVIQGTTPVKGKGKGKGKAKRKDPPASQASPVSLAFQGGANIHTLSGSSSGSSSRVGGGGGGGLGSGGGGKRRRVNVELGSEEDIGLMLLKAVSGGGGGRGSQCMRAAFKMAVGTQYNETKVSTGDWEAPHDLTRREGETSEVTCGLVVVQQADARLAAARAGLYSIHEAGGTRRLADGAAARMRVEFSKGDGFRSNYEDEVELWSKAQLLGVMVQVLGDEDAREMLKPRNMAGCSPRVFWSLVKHFGGDIEVGLRTLMPQQDWNFLHERMRKLSEKALMNKEQEEEEKREKEEEKKAKEREAREKAELRQAKAASLALVGPGGEEIIEVDADAAQPGVQAPLSDRDRRAQAALARLGGKGPAQEGEEDEGPDEWFKEDEEFPDSVDDEYFDIITDDSVGVCTVMDLASADAKELLKKIRTLGRKVRHMAVDLMTNDDPVVAEAILPNKSGRCRRKRRWSSGSTRPKSRRSST
jgi:hypothetical protein